MTQRQLTISLGCLLLFSWAFLLFLTYPKPLADLQTEHPKQPTQPRISMTPGVDLDNPWETPKEP